MEATFISLMDYLIFRFALKTVVNDKKLQCPGRSNPNKDTNKDTSSNTLGVVQVVLLGICAVFLAVLSLVAVLRFINGRREYVDI